MRPTLLFLLACLVAGSPALSERSAHAKIDKALVEKAFATLERGARSGDFTARAIAVRGLGFAPKKQALPIVLAALEDQQWQVRRAVIRSLLTLKDRTWQKAVIDAMRTPSLDAGKQVFPLIEALGVKVGTKLALKALNDTTFPKPERYAKAFAKASQEWMLATYRQGLRLKNGIALSAFVDQLDKLPLPDAMPLYKEVLLKQSPEVQHKVLVYVLASPAVKDLSFLRPLLKAKDEQVAFDTAAALAHRGDASGRIKLVAAANQDEDKARRLTALKALLGVAGKDLFPIIKPIALDEKSEVPEVVACYEIYAKVGNPKLAGHLQKRIEGTDLDRRAAAVPFLGRVMGLGALRILEPLLTDGAKVIRIGAARAIGDLGQRGSIQPLNEALFNENDPEVKVAFIKALGAIRDPEAVGPLRFQIGDRDLAVRRTAVEALAAINHESAVPDLEVALRDMDPEIRRIALRALLHLSPTRHMRAFESALGWIAPEDIAALAEEHGKELLPHLRLALEATRREIREAAFDALSVLDEATRQQELETLATKSERPDLRVRAIRALAEVKGKEMIPMLRTLAADAELAVRLIAIAELGKLKDKESEAALVGMLDDEQEQVRVSAAMALLQL